MADFRLLRRFLLRGSTLIVAVLCLWWFALLSPLLFLLHITTSTVFRALPFDSTPSYSVSASGEWDGQVPIHDTYADRRVDTARFTVPRDTLVTFTYSLPIYWALVLAIPSSKAEISSRLRILILGSMVVISAEALSAMTYIEITVMAALAQLQPDANSFGPWFRALTDYLAMFVAPLLVPFITLAVFDRRARAMFTERPT